MSYNCIFLRSGNWKQALSKDINADQLPIHFGGNSNEPADGYPFLPVGFVLLIAKFRNTQSALSQVCNDYVSVSMEERNAETERTMSIDDVRLHPITPEVHLNSVKATSVPLTIS
jgi:hypothetical protein